MKETLRNTIALLVGMLAIMAGISYQSVILGVRGAGGFDDVQLGIITAMNFVGFLAGSVFIPSRVNSVGHVRTFAAMTAIFSGSVLLFPVAEEIFLWSALQFISGFAAAGLFVVAESWLNDATENSERGQLMAIYLVLCMLGKIFGYNATYFGNVDSYAHFTAISIIVSLAGVPMLLSAGSSPQLNPPERLGLRELYKVSPTGIIAVAVNAVVVGMINGYGPVFGVRIGLSTAEVGLFLTAIMLGALAGQIPFGRLSDKVDRRYVIAGVCGLGALTSLVFLLLSPTEGWFFWVMLFVLGACSFTVYPLGCAHTNDNLRPSQRVAACGGLLITAASGMAIGPFLGGVAVEFLGNGAFYGICLICAVFLAIFSLLRVRVRAAPADEQSVDFVPVISGRSSVAVAEMVALESQTEDDSSSPSL